jgi:hypothetical protein
MTTKKQTAFHQLAQVMRDLEGDLGWRLKDSPRIPAAWHEIAGQRIQPLKRSVTIRIDEDVIKFFAGKAGRGGEGRGRLHTPARGVGGI